MIIKLNELRNKILGCWMGKNIGGTLGAPFEGFRQVNSVDFYLQNLDGNPLPNDDLDLQLIWLNAVEKYGRAINSSILGEYWLTLVTGNANEYGIAQANLRKGIVPPLSGYVNNTYKDSNGGWIRSEIWACLAPGHPEIAVRYAFEDAIVDHSHEGVYAEIFTAALESAAFVENDKYKLIEIGLSYIPEDCWVAKGVRKTIDCYTLGMSWLDARAKLFTEIPGAFSQLNSTNISEADKQIPFAAQGFDAPNNILILVLAWLYGEDDFGNSLCIAVNFGEDTDCTAATLGSILGIIHGLDSIPEKWIKPIGDKINTIYINRTEFFSNFIPETVTELTDRVLKLIPLFLGGDICDYITSEQGYTINALEGEDLYSRATRKSNFVTERFSDILKLSPFTVRYDFITYTALLDYTEEPFIRRNAQKRFRLILENMISKPQNIRIKWHVPEGFTVTPCAVICAFIDHSYIKNTNLEFTVCAEVLDRDRYDLLIEMISEGHVTKGIIPIVLINEG